MTTPHAQRSHATFAASATARNVVCAGAIAMETLIDEDESEAAAWGTACHEWAELCLKNDVDMESFRDQVKKIGRFEIDCDEEMIDCGQTYVDYVTEEIAREECLFWFEERLSLADLKPALDSGGTGDAIIYRKKSRLLKIIDLKGGRGVVVDVEGNPQARSYALGAVLKFLHLDIERIEATIVQPRAPHKDGIIRSETFHLADLLEWSGWLLKKNALCAEALAEFERIDGNRVKFDEWAARWLVTGQCTFCRARGICPKFRGEAMAALPKRAQQWFEEETDDGAEVLANHPATASPEELSRILDKLDALEGWVKAVRERAHRTAERGVAIPEYGLVDKIGNRAFIEKDEAKLARELRLVLNLGDEMYAPRKIKSVAQIEKTLGSARKKEFAGLEKKLWERPVRGTNLVRLDKTTREPAASKPEQHFEKVEN